MATTEFISEVNKAIDFYEDTIGGSAGRTRQMIRDSGEVESLSKLVQSPDLQSGFKVLRDRNQLNLSFEAVITRHAELFDEQIVQAAQWRLDHANELL